MKRILMILALIYSTLPSMAQQGLHVDKLFEGNIIPQERMVETRVRGKAVSKYGLTYFRSLRFRASKEEVRSIETLILKDAGEEMTVSVMKRVGGLATGGTLQLPPVGTAKRLICYKYAAGEVLVIYMEGPNAVPETIGKMTK